MTDSIPEDGWNDSQLIHKSEIDKWAKDFHGHKMPNELQKLVFQNFTESCVRLIERRVELHLTALKFHEAGRLNTTTMAVQQDYYYRTEVFFQGFYSTLAQLANVVHRFPMIFEDIQCSSNQKFLETLKSSYPELIEACDLIEAARAHRAFLDHPVSNQTANWMTFSTGDKRQMQILHFGAKSRSGNVPVNAELGGFGPIQQDWHKVTPSYFDVEQNFKILINFVVNTILKTK